MPTVRDLITQAGRVLGVLAEGEEFSPEGAADGLACLRRMLDSWSAQRRTCFATLTQSFDWPAGKLTQTIGPTGDLVGLRPVQVISRSTCYVDVSSGITYNLTQLDQDQWNTIPVKSVESSYPQVFYVNYTFPNIEFSMWPRAQRVINLKLVSQLELVHVTDFDVDVSLPPGYERAVVANLALEVAPEYGVPWSGDLKRIAANSLAVIKRNNQPSIRLAIPGELVQNKARYNIFSDSGT